MAYRLLMSKVEDGVGLPFAVDELECSNVAAGASPIVHIWRHPRAVVLGLRDRRLPCARQAMDELEEAGWSVMVRNSGGAAVPLDDGVVNITLITPSKPGAVHIHEDFRVMAQLVRDAVRLLVNNRDPNIQSGEIAGAYCPGEYDLAIDGYKFCGIAQRRRIGANIVQAFVVVEGSGADRVKTVAQYYDTASRGEAASNANALQVNEHSTRSLQELLGETAAITSDRFAEAVRTAILGDSLPISEARDYSLYDLVELRQMVATMKQRYDTD